MQATYLPVIRWTVVSHALIKWGKWWSPKDFLVGQVGNLFATTADADRGQNVDRSEKG